MPTYYLSTVARTYGEALIEVARNAHKAELELASELINADIDSWDKI